MAIWASDDFVGTPTSGDVVPASHATMDAIATGVSAPTYTDHLVGGRRCIVPASNTYSWVRLSIGTRTRIRIRWIAEWEAGPGTAGHHFMVMLATSALAYLGDTQIRNTTGPPVYNRWNFTSGGTTIAWPQLTPWRFELEWQSGGSVLYVWTDPASTGSPDHTITATGTGTVGQIGWGNTNGTSGRLVYFAAVAVSDGELIGPDAETHSGASGGSVVTAGAGQGRSERSGASGGVVTAAVAGEAATGRTGASSGTVVVTGGGEGATPRAGGSGGTVHVAGDGSGLPHRAGTSGGIILAATDGAGLAQRLGSSGGAVVAAGDGAGHVQRAGASGGSVLLAGAGSGATHRLGTSGGTVIVTGAGSGAASVPDSGASGGTVLLTGGGAGTATRAGAASGLVLVETTGTGTATRQGSASGLIVVHIHGSGHEGAPPPVLTPSTRTLVVPADGRGLTVPADHRHLDVVAESRTLNA